MILTQNKIANKRARRAAVAWMILAVLFAMATAIADGFFTTGNIGNLVQQMLPTLITALGQMTVILLAGLDLSVGAVVGLTTGIMVADLPVVAKLTLAISAGLTIGAINGVGVARLRIHPIIMTLAMMTVVQGLALWVLPAPGGKTDPVIVALASGHLLGLHASVFWAALTIAVFYWMIHRTWFGLHLFAVGGNEDYAKLAGSRVVRVTVIAYSISSLCAVFAGIYLAGRLSSGDPNIGDLLTLDSIVAAAIGGTSLSGGMGTVVGVVGGTAILGVSGNMLNLLNVPPFYQFVLKGGLLILAVSFFRRPIRGL